ncbi:MAG: dinitrogenase iron-molybdenum cofactor biosynthesis protein [Gammaproteobacteria bacterium]
MSTQPISNEIALRIALAARELPDTDVARLLRVLQAAVGLPPTKKKLADLKVKDLKSAADGEFAEMDHAALKAALSRLQDESGDPEDLLPEVARYRDGDMPNSIRVACASNHGEMLDGHFGSCRRFLIYQVASSEVRLIDIREVENEQEAEDKNSYRAFLIQDCQLLFIGSIGGPAAAKVIRANIHPVKKPNPCPAREEMEALRKVIGREAPPWLAKAMGQPPEKRIRFEQEREEARA